MLIIRLLKDADAPLMRGAEKGARLATKTAGICDEHDKGAWNGAALRGDSYFPTARREISRERA
jgi:hypothetical protein